MKITSRAWGFLRVGLNGSFGARPAQFAVGGTFDNPLLDDVDAGDDLVEFVLVPGTLPASGDWELSSRGGLTHSGAADGTYTTTATLYTFTPGDAAVVNEGTEDIVTQFGAASVTSDLVATYGVQAAVTCDLVASYAVIGAVAQDLAVSFDIVGTAASDLVATYSVLGSVQQDLVATYKVRPIEFINGMNSGSTPSAQPTAQVVLDCYADRTIFVGISSYTTPGARTVTGVTDTAGNEYTQAGGSFGGDGNHNQCLWTARSETDQAGNVITVQFSGSAAYRVVAAVQYDGVALNPFDVAAAGKLDASNVVVHETNSLATTEDDALVLGWFVDWAGWLSSFTSTSGGSTARAASGTASVFAERIVGAAGSYTAQVQTTAVGQMASVAIAFKAAANAAGSTTTVTSDLVATYTVVAGVSQDLVATYAVQGAVEQDLVATYTVVAGVSQDLVAAYTVIGAAAQDLAAAYAVQGSADLDLVAAYAVQGSVAQDLAASYAVQAAAALDLAPSYAVAGIVDSDLAAAYGIRGTVEQDLAAAYEVLAAGSVTKDLAVSFDIVGTAASDLVAAYGVLNAAEQDLAALYAVQAAAAQDLAASYAIRGDAAKDLVAEYALLAAVEADLVAEWAMSGAVASDLVAAYSVYGGGGSGASAAEVAEAVWKYIVEGGLTAERMQRVMFAALAGKSSGVGTDGPEVYYGRDGTTPRLTVTFDAFGNRETVAVNGA